MLGGPDAERAVRRRFASCNGSKWPQNRAVALSGAVFWRDAGGGAIPLPPRR